MVHLCFYPNSVGLNKTLSKHVVWTTSKHGWFLQRPYVVKKGVHFKKPSVQHV